MSYRVLLIDDNQLALESMEKTIPWAEHDLELVGCASNGIQGCQMIRSLQSGHPHQRYPDAGDGRPDHAGADEK